MIHVCDRDGEDGSGHKCKRSYSTSLSVAPAVLAHRLLHARPVCSRQTATPLTGIPQARKVRRMHCLISVQPTTVLANCAQSKSRLQCSLLRCKTRSPDTNMSSVFTTNAQFLASGLQNLDFSLYHKPNPNRINPQSQTPQAKPSISPIGQKSQTCHPRGEVKTEPSGCQPLHFIPKLSGLASEATWRDPAKLKPRLGIFGISGVCKGGRLRHIK